MQELFLLCTILCLITEGAPYAGDIQENREDDIQSIWVDQGANYTLPCGAVSVRGGEPPIMWVHEDTKDASLTKRIQTDGSIFFSSMKKSDSGVHACKLESYFNSNYHSRRTLSNEDSYEARVRLRVRTPPHVLKNVTVTPSTILASLVWEIDKDGDGGYPIENFQITYRQKNSTENWKTCLPAFIGPNERQYSIYHLEPNSTYLIKLWANNKLGPGPSAIIETQTHNDPQEIELQKHLLEGFDSFDVRIWIIAVGIVISTLLILGVATCCLFYKEYTMNLATDSRDVDGESIELMPNIILNPGYDFQSMEVSEPDENSNDTTALLINNNSVVHPARV